MKPKAGVESTSKGKNQNENQKQPAETDKRDSKGKEAKPPQTKNQKGSKGKNLENEKESEEEVIPPPVKEKNLERFIYVTVYNDSELVRKLKELFEEINREAFQLKSVKEIYTKGLTEEERDDNDKDYISGCQLIDKDRRITLIEGLSGKAMDKVKEKLPKTQMNSATYKVFADSNVLFNKRIYSKFDLSLKYIKLRDPLSIILTTYDIYAKANKLREIYNAFLSFGTILKAQTMAELFEGNIFPNSESLLLLERKYADILTEEDLTGIHIIKKQKKRMKTDSMDKSSIINTTSQSSADIQISQKDQPLVLIEPQALENEKEKGKNKMKASLDSHNILYEEYLKKSHSRKTGADTLKTNFDYLKTMKKKPPQGHFCKPIESYDLNEVVSLYSTSKNNYYEKCLNIMREKYSKDAKNYYTYSKHSLALSFPMLPNRNYEYAEYIDNKSKWINKNDFNRYEQPKRDTVFFPKINNVL